MKIADIQQAVSGCCSTLTSNASGAAAWAGRTVQTLGGKTVETVKTFGSTAWCTANKAALIGLAYLTKASLAAKAFACSAWQNTQCAGSRAWEASKVLGNRSIETAKIVGENILCGSKAAGCAIKCTSLKIAGAASEALSKTKRVMKEVAIAGKTGLAQGFQSTRVFVATHQKETAVAGIALAVGFAILATYRAYYREPAV